MTAWAEVLVIDWLIVRGGGGMGVIFRNRVATKESYFVLRGGNTVSIALPYRRERVLYI